MLDEGLRAANSSGGLQLQLNLSWLVVIQLRNIDGSFIEIFMLEGVLKKLSYTLEFALITAFSSIKHVIFFLVEIVKAIMTKVCLMNELVHKKI